MWRSILTLTLCGLGPLAAQDEGVHLHLCTIATDTTEGVSELADSSQIQGLPIDVLGIGVSIDKPQARLNLLKQYLADLPDHDVVLFVDSEDTAILAPANKILKKFQAKNAPFVFSTERFCWPFADKASLYPEGASTYQYIHVGAFIGYVEALKTLLDEPALKEARDLDQAVVTLHYLENREQYSLDDTCDLFFLLPGTLDNDLSVNPKALKVKCVETGSTPCILRGTINTKPLYRQTYNRLFLDNGQFSAEVTEVTESIESSEEAAIGH